MVSAVVLEECPVGTKVFRNFLESDINVSEYGVSGKAFPVPDRKLYMRGKQFSAPSILLKARVPHGG